MEDWQPDVDNDMEVVGGIRIEAIVPLPSGALNIATHMEPTDEHDGVGMVPLPIEDLTWGQLWRLRRCLRTGESAQFCYDGEREYGDLDTEKFPTAFEEALDSVQVIVGEVPDLIRSVSRGVISEPAGRLKMRALNRFFS